MPRSKSPNGSSYSVQRLRANHYKILDMRVAGFSNKEIAATVGCSCETVMSLVRSPIFQHEYQIKLKNRDSAVVSDHRDAFMGKITSILQQASEQAANTQVDLLESEDDSIRLRASGSILDRVLGKPGGSEQGGVSTVVNIDAEKAQLLIIALKESDHASARRFHVEDAVPYESPARATED